MSTKQHSSPAAIEAALRASAAQKPELALERARAKAARIQESGLRYLSPRTEETPFYELDELEALLETELTGKVVDGPIRTRSKLAKQLVCGVLGYPIPSSFVRVRPRILNQNLDVYVQKSNNLQVWNEEVDPLRRFALLRVDERDEITRIRVVSGETIALFDKTGTLTGKYQAKRKSGREGSSLVSPNDTGPFIQALAPIAEVDPLVLRALSPTAKPQVGAVLTIDALYERLGSLVGETIENPGDDQERNRGAGLHKATCEAIGLGDYADSGQVPDILCQALEVKFQTSPTVDLGLVRPDSTAAAPSLGDGLRHCDTRYLVAFGDLTLDGRRVQINDIVLATGQDFFDEFQGFGGLTVNKKLQIPLPRDFFD